MRNLAFLFLAAGPLGAADTVPAAVESTLATNGGQIRQFAFDGDEKTFFASAKNPVKGDSFTLLLDKPVKAKAVKALTGKPTGEDVLDAGELEVSADGKKFETLAAFKDGKAEGTPKVTVRRTPFYAAVLSSESFLLRGHIDGESGTGSGAGASLA